MTKSKYQGKTRSDKFPLTLHKTGQFCKKIKGKIYYFGTDKKTAFNRYLEQAAYLRADKQPKSRMFSFRSTKEPSNSIFSCCLNFRGKRLRSKFSNIFSVGSFDALIIRLSC
jgi:hypothetical protein